MARTLYFTDGSREVIFCGDDPDKQKSALERILRERLGDDLAAFFRELTLPRQYENLESMEQELESYEESAEAYCSCLQEVLDGLRKAVSLLDGKRLNRKELHRLLISLMTKIDNEI